VRPDATVDEPKCKDTVDAITGDDWRENDCVGIPTAASNVMNCYAPDGLARYWKQRGNSFKDPSVGDASWTERFRPTCDPTRRIPELHEQHDMERTELYQRTIDGMDEAARIAQEEASSSEVREARDRARREQLRRQNPALYADAERVRAEAERVRAEAERNRLAAIKQQAEALKTADFGTYEKDTISDMMSDLNSMPSSNEIVELLTALRELRQRKQEFDSNLRIQGMLQALLAKTNGELLAYVRNEMNELRDDYSFRINGDDMDNSGAERLRAAEMALGRLQDRVQTVQEREELQRLQRKVDRHHRRDERYAERERVMRAHMSHRSRSSTDSF
jgi:hypothetical protein